jgi:hypothetical protein
LTPRALAYWLSGDGCFEKSKGLIRISTDSFTTGELYLLRAVLLDNLNIETTRVSNGQGKNQYIIGYQNVKSQKYRILLNHFFPPGLKSRALILYCGMKELLAGLAP